MLSLIRGAKRLAWVFVTRLFAVFAVTAGFIAYDGLHDRLGKADVAVVLGAKVDRDGTPSAALRVRLDEAGALYAQGYFPRVIVSGGRGDEGFDEALVMRDYLIRHGVPATAILLDHHGVNTYASAINVTRWMRANHAGRVLLVSQFFHMSRSRLAFERCGAPVVYTAHAPRVDWRDLMGLGRDTAGYYTYWLIDYGCAPEG